MADEENEDKPEISAEEKAAIRRVLFKAFHKPAQNVLADLIAELGELRAKESPERVLLRLLVTFAFLRFISAKHQLQGRS